MGNIEVIELIIIFWNAIVFSFYGIDKLKAKLHKSRISEKTLLISAFLTGSLGAILGMVVFNHKTSKPQFRYLIPLFFVLHMLAVFFLVNKYNFLYIG